MSTKLRFVGILAVLMTVVVVTGCGSASEASGNNASSNPIKIGVPLPLTGKLAQTGDLLLAGIKYAQQEVNQSGGVDGRQVQLITADTQADPATAAHVATSLITQDKVDALVGGYGSTPDFAMLTAIARYKKLFIHTSSSAINLAQKFGPDDWYFHVYIWDPYRAQALTSFLQTLNPHPATVAIAHESGLYGTTGAQQAKADLTQAGFTVVDSIPFTAGTADFTPVIQKVAGDHPDVLYFIGYEGDNVLMAQQAKAQHLNVKLLVNVGAGETEAQYGQDVAQGICSVDVFNPNMNIPNLQDWVQKIQKAENVSATGAVAQGYAGMITLLDAMRSAHSTDQSKVIDHLSHDQFWTPFGTLGYRSGMPGDLHQLTLPDNMVVYQYSGSNTVVVWPQAAANGTVKYPTNQ